MSDNLFIFLKILKTVVMNYWLVKSEPSTYGWEQFVKDKKTTWDGVRNYAARITFACNEKR